jgi:hypothetical protein
MLQAFLWAVTTFIISIIFAAIAGQDDETFIHNISNFLNTVFSLAFWGCLAWWVIEVILWALPIMIG